MTFYKTLFARMGNIKAGKYTSDEGEDLNDTEKVLKKNGILLRDSTNEFRNFGDVLDEVASKWDNYDNVTQHAIATAFAGTRQQEKFFVLMENYGKALEYEAVAAESAGTANQKYTDAYLDSIEARKNSMKAAFESLSQTILNPQILMSVYGIAEKIITLIDKFLNTALGKIVGGVVAGRIIFKLMTKVPALIATISATLTNVIAKLFKIELSEDKIEKKAAKIKNVASTIGSILTTVALATTAVVTLFDAIQTGIDNSSKSISEEAIDKWNSERDAYYNLSELLSKYKELNLSSEEYASLEEQITSVLGEKATQLETLTKNTDEYRKAVENLSDAELDAYRKDLSRAAAEASGNIEAADIWNVGGTKWWNRGFASTRYYQWQTSANDITLSDGTTVNIADILGSNGVGVGRSAGDVTSIVSIAGRGGNKTSRINDYFTYLKAFEALDKYANNSDAKVRDQIWTSSAYTDLEGAVKAGASIQTAIQKYVELYIIENADATIEGAKKYIDDIFGDVSRGYAGTKIEEWFNGLTGGGTSGSSGLPRLEIPGIQTLFDTLANSKDFNDTTEAVETLAGAIEEMDGKGRLSIETAQKLLELGDEYAETLTVENGELKINTDVLRTLAGNRILAARAAAVENGATKETVELYTELWKAATRLGETDMLDRYLGLLDYENTIFEFSGNEYDSRRLQNAERALTGIRRQIEHMRGSGIAADDETLMGLYKTYISYAEKAIKLNQEIAATNEDALKESIEKENDALEEQKDLLDQILDARKKALDTAKDEASYQKELQERQKAVSDLQTQLAAARLDTSASGRARVRSLESELSKAQEELDDFNLEHATDIISEQIDKEIEENESLYEKQKKDNDDRLQKFIDSNKLQQEAYEAKIKGYYDIVESALGNLDPDKEGSPAQKLRSIEAILAEMAPKIGSTNYDMLTAKLARLTDSQVQQAKMLAEKMANDQAKSKTALAAGSSWDWNKAYEENLQMFADDPEKIKKWLSAYGLATYHSGGIVDELGLGDNEVFAKLMKGEYVATPTQMSNFLRKTLPNMTGIGGSQQFNAPLITVTCGSVTEESLPKLESIVKSAADKIKSELTSAFDKTGFRSSNKRILAY